MLFLSTFHNRIDKKGRISVPAPFRAALAAQEFQGIVAYRSLVNPCIEACGMARIEKLYRQLDMLDPFSEERDALTTTLLGESVQLAFDSEGRIGLPPALLEAAGITGEAVFLGKGETFELWAPKPFAAYAEQARKTAYDKRLALRAPRGGGQP